jgi:hypothetical protein
MEKYWALRLKNCKDALEENNFSAFIAETPSDAKKIVIDQILPEIDIKSHWCPVKNRINSVGYGQ